MTNRPLGWLLAGASSAALLSGAAALALVAEQRPEPVPMALDLSMVPASAPNIAAMADPAPQVVDEVSDQADQPAPPETEPPPDLFADTAPDLPQQSALSLPRHDTPVVADLTLPPPPEEPMPEVENPVEQVVKPKPKPEKKPEKSAKPKPEKKPVERAKEPAKTAEKPEAVEKPREKASEKKAAAAGATAATAGSKAKGGAKVSPAAYAKSVIKKVRGTKKKRASARGTVLVAFSVGRDGGLAGVKVAQSSGNAELDQIALDHIRRSAPFPVPPEGVGRNFSFEFTGK
jgi:protein TonB